MTEQVAELPLTDSSQTVTAVTMDGSGDKTSPAVEAGKGGKEVVGAQVEAKVEPMQVNNGDGGKSNDAVETQEKPAEVASVNDTATSQPQTSVAVAMETGENTNVVINEKEGESKGNVSSQEKVTESSTADVTDTAIVQSEATVAMDTEASVMVESGEKAGDLVAATGTMPSGTDQTSQQAPGNDANSAESQTVKTGTKRPASEEAEGVCEPKVAAVSAESETVGDVVPSETNVTVPQESGTVVNTSVVADVPISTSDTQTTSACKRPAPEEAEGVCKQRITESTTDNEAASVSADLPQQGSSSVDNEKSSIRSTETIPGNSTDACDGNVVSTSKEPVVICKEMVPETMEQPAGQADVKAAIVSHDKADKVESSPASEAVATSSVSQAAAASEAAETTDVSVITPPVSTEAPEKQDFSGVKSKEANLPAANTKVEESDKDDIITGATPSADLQGAAITGTGADNVKDVATSKVTPTAATNPDAQAASTAVNNPDAANSEAMPAKGTSATTVIDTVEKDVPNAEHVEVAAPLVTKSEDAASENAPTAVNPTALPTPDIKPVDSTIQAPGTESQQVSQAPPPVDSTTQPVMGNGGKTTPSATSTEANTTSSSEGQVSQTERTTDNVPTDAVTTADSTVASSSATEAAATTPVQASSGQGAEAQVSAADPATAASNQPAGTEQQDRSAEPTQVSTTPVASALTVAVGEPAPPDTSELYSPTSAYAEACAGDDGPPGEGPVITPSVSDSQKETVAATVAGEAATDVSSPYTPTLGEDAVDPNAADNGPPGEDTAAAAVTTSSDSLEDVGQPITVRAASVTAAYKAANSTNQFNKQWSQQQAPPANNTTSYPTYNGQMQWNQGNAGAQFGQYGAQRPPNMNNSLAYAQQYSQWQQNYSGTGQQPPAGQYYNYGQYGGYGQGYPGQMYNQGYNQGYNQQQGYNQAYMQQQQGYPHAQQQGYYDWSQSQGYNYGDYYNTQNQTSQSPYSQPPPPLPATTQVKAPLLQTPSPSQRNVISVPLSTSTPATKDLSAIPLPPMNRVTPSQLQALMVPQPQQAVTEAAQMKPAPIISARTKEEIAAQLLQKARAKQVDQPPPSVAVEPPPPAVEKPAAEERRQVPDPMVTPKHLCIGNLPEGTKATALRDMLAYFGKVVSCKVAAGKGANAGIFAFVTIDCLTDASTLISSLNGWEFNGSKLTAKKLKSIPGSKSK